MSSTRSQPQAGIGRSDVARLHPVWRFRIPAPAGDSGAMTATPVVSGDTVYVQDMQSNVYALELRSGRLRWRHRFAAGTPGPNGLAFADGRVHGATDTTAFALSAGTGRILWQRRLATPVENFVDTAPQVAGGLVYWSTAGYGPGTRGAAYALDAATGAVRWRFDTIRGAWRHPGEAGGGGAWMAPSVGRDGLVYWGTANPTPWGGTRARPNGGSYPGPALYTDSLLALGARDGALAWFDQVTPHDVRDHDFQLPPVLVGRRVIGAGKSGVVIAWDAGSHRRLWQTRVGVHRNDTGRLPRRLVPVCPGLLGGVETPMASADGRVFAPVVNLCTPGSATGYLPLGKVDPRRGRAAFVALDVQSGRVLWSRRLPQPDFGCATVANGVVFTSTFDGTVYGLDTRDGSVLWRTRTRAGVNACPALAHGLLLVPAGVPLGAGAPELVAFGAG